MYLKSIELSGFKSFAKKSSLEFTSPITSVVGPNGSGKSNVAEAFRFVLGEQSIKSLRGKRGEDLIFNGGGGEARANRASVRIVFDNSSKVFGIDFPEVSIERVVHRDGANEYLINGSQARLKDILELLASAHIGASGHHIISQGEADKILNATPKDRKSMIEDALGLKVYQYKRIESERKLRKTFENINQVESLRREIAPHLKFLRKQVEKFEKAESQRLELIELGKAYFIKETSYISGSRAVIAGEKRPVEEGLERLAKELADARAVLEDAAKENKKDYAVLDLESDLTKVRMQKDALSRELGKAEGLIGAEERIIRKEKELAASDAHKMIRLRDVEELYSELEDDIKAAESGDAAGLLKALKALAEKVSHFIRARKETADSSIILEAEKSLVGLMKDKERIEHELRDARKEEEELGTKLSALKQSIEASKDSSRDAEKAVFRIMSEEQSLISQLELLKAREERLEAEDADLKRELEEVARLAGAEVLHFKTESSEEAAKETQTALAEPRSIQEEAKRALERLKIRLEDAGVSGQGETLKEYTETAERDEFLARELLDLEKSAESLRELVSELEERLAAEFSTGVEKINSEFNDFFSKMFGGGEAHLTLIKEKKKKAEAILEGSDDAEALDDDDDSDEVVEVGLDIAVSLPRKKIKGLVMLSGGERALTSIALLFAISQVNPPPFVILDETDAALDEANSRRYGDMVEALSKYSQLILITHNRETMSRAGTIYGVTMSSTGISKLLSIQFDEAVQVAK